MTTELSHILPKDLQILTFVAPAPVLEAVKVTEENILDLAKWMEADNYTIAHDLERDVKTVHFERKREGSSYPDVIVRTMIGGYIMKFPEGVSPAGGHFSERLYGIEQNDVDRFIRQTMDLGHIEFDPPYYR